VKRLKDSVAAAIAWRYAAHAAMVAMALWNEARAAPQLPDLILARVPRVDWLARHNYQLWVIAWVPLAILLLLRDRPRFLRFMWVGGWLSLVRGFCIPLTGLGPVSGGDPNAGADAAMLWRAWLAIVNPISALTTDAPHAGLTKDLFFSGHVASTLLLWLYCRPVPGLGLPALAAHTATTAIVFLSHLHYSIDVVAAWAITFSVYALAEGVGPLRPKDPPAMDMKN
jgi:hypothetical protein